MATIKLTPLVLFLIILFVLVISVIFGRWLNIEEGFISFQKNQAINASTIIPQYSNSEVYKLYDNLYYDYSNGNIIVITSTTQYTTDDLIDTSGGTISGIQIIPRAGTPITTIATTRDSIGVIIPASTSNPTLISSKISSSYSSWVSTVGYPTIPYQIIYMPWNTSTFIHLVDASSATPALDPLASFLFSDGNVQDSYVWKNSLNVGLPGYLSEQTIPPKPTVNMTANSSTDINKLINEPYYDTSHNGYTYMVSDFVKFDTKNGNLIIKHRSDASYNIDVYNGNVNAAGNPVMDASNINTVNGYNSTTYPAEKQSISSANGFIPFMVADGSGQNTVLYMKTAQKTLVALLALNTTNNLYQLRTVVRFNPAISSPGVETANPVTSTDATAATAATDATAATAATDATAATVAAAATANLTLDQVISDYYKKYWYTNQTASGMTKYSDDFLLKSQIIPPICPACPSCPSSTTCTNCGGTGGSGLLGLDHSNVVGGLAQGAGNLAGGVALGTGILAGGAIHGAGNLAGGAIQGAGDVAEGAGKLAGGAIQGAGNLAGGAIQGAGNVVGGIASGIGNIVGGALSSNRGYGSSQYSNYGDSYNSNSGNNGPNQGYNQGPNQDTDQGYNQGPNQSTNQKNIDKYSYNGALTSKGGNPMPVTSDFSRFGK